jgi:hypothetical protein
MDSEFNPYHKWFGIPLEDQPANHYRLLGVELLEDDHDIIEAATQQRMIFVRQCALGAHADWSQRLLNEIAQAQRCLLDPKTKLIYDATLDTTPDKQAELNLAAADVDLPPSTDSFPVEEQELELVPLADDELVLREPPTGDEQAELKLQPNEARRDLHVATYADAETVSSRKPPTPKEAADAHFPRKRLWAVIICSGIVALILLSAIVALLVS